MEGILTTFGIDWRLLLIQAANFGILLFGLWYFLYTPMMKTLEDRRKKVSQGVLDAQTAERKLSEIEGARASVLANAGKEADTILSHAQSRAGAKEREMLAHAEVSAASVLSEAEAQAHEAKARAISESKEEVAKLIVLGVEKMLAK
ncbi:MAG: F-type H+-transporting ATPase subunit b [Parcubacteria group bacterium Gr01-1014_56]|nr:MAG: F-type H+-transporting ATPase subunit b [Parcubacteria group bacterium Gr01-1014_56]